MRWITLNESDIEHTYFTCNREIKMLGIYHALLLKYSFTAYFSIAKITSIKLQRDTYTYLFETWHLLRSEGQNLIQLCNAVH